MNLKITFLLLFLIFTIMYSCAPVRHVVPLKKGEKDISLSFGGPLIGFAGTTIPLPLTSLSYAQGLDDTYTLSAGLHTTAMAFGVIQTEFSILRNIWLSEDGKTGFSASPSMYLMCDVWEYKPKFYPWVDINFYTHYGEKGHLMYFSYSSMFELSKTKAFEEKIDNRYIPFMSMGHKWSLNKWDIKLETKYINFLKSNENIAVDYKVPGSKGAMGVYFGIIRKLY